MSAGAHADLAARVEAASRRRTGTLDAEAVEEAIGLLDAARSASPSPTDGGWRVNAWVKEAVLLYFRVRGLETIEVGPVRVPRPAAAEARVRGRGRPRGAARHGRATARSCRRASC